LIYGDYRQVEQPGLGRLLALQSLCDKDGSYFSRILIFLEEIRGPACLGTPGLSPASPNVNPGLVKSNKQSLALQFGFERFRYVSLNCCKFSLLRPKSVIEWAAFICHSMCGPG